MIAEFKKSIGNGYPPSNSNLRYDSPIHRGGFNIKEWVNTQTQKRQNQENDSAFAFEVIDYQKEIIVDLNGLIKCKKKLNI